MTLGMIVLVEAFIVFLVFSASKKDGYLYPKFWKAYGVLIVSNVFLYFLLFSVFSKIPSAKNETPAQITSAMFTFFLGLFLTMLYIIISKEKIKGGTLEDFLKQELGCKTKPMYKDLKESDDGFMQAAAALWDKETLNAKEKFLIMEILTPEFKEKVQSLIPKFFTGKGYVVTLQHPIEKDGISFLFMLKKEKERLFVSVTYETVHTFIAVSEEL